MSIVLRPMTDAEFDAWLAVGRADWAAERRNLGESAEVADHIAAEQYEQWFPGGTRGARHELFVVEDDGVAVGRAWIGPHPQAPDNAESAWLYDIELDERVRGRGLGRATLTAVEDHLRAAGVTQLGLNVFGGNAVARGLYRSAGFAEVAITMSKQVIGEQVR